MTVFVRFVPGSEPLGALKLSTRIRSITRRVQSQIFTGDGIQLNISTGIRSEASSWRTLVLAMAGYALASLVSRPQSVKQSMRHSTQHRVHEQPTSRGISPTACSSGE